MNLARRTVGSMRAQKRPESVCIVPESPVYGQPDEADREPDNAALKLMQDILHPQRGCVLAADQKTIVVQWVAYGLSLHQLHLIRNMQQNRLLEADIKHAVAAMGQVMRKPALHKLYLSPHHAP